MKLGGVALVVMLGGALAALGVAGRPDRVQLPPGPARIHVTAVLEAEQRVIPSVSERVYDLYNRPAYKRPVGHALLLCTRTSSQWVACSLYLRFGRGQIVGTAAVPAAARLYQLGVIGGTGYYSNTGGTVVLQFVDTRHADVQVVLEAF